MNKKTLFLFLLGLVALPSLVSAQVTLASMAEGAMFAILGAVGFVVVIMWVVTGILFLIAAGNPEKINAAKISLVAAVIGTVIIIIAQYATDFIGGIFRI